MLSRFLLLLFIILATVPYTKAHSGHTEADDPARVSFLAPQPTYFNAATQQQLRQQPAWQSFVQQHGTWWVQFDERTGLPHRAYGEPIPWGGLQEPVQAALSFLRNGMADYDIPVEDLHVTQVVEKEEFTLVKMAQQHEGLPVLWSQVSVRFNADGAVMHFGVDAFPQMQLSTTPHLSSAQLADAATEGIPYDVQQVQLNDLAILPVPGEQGVDYRLVQQVEVMTRGWQDEPGRYYTLVDAHTGKVWYRVNQVHTCAPKLADARINGDVVDNPLRNPVNRAIPDLMVVVGTDTFYTDTSGQVILPNLTQKVEAEIYLAGRHARVVNDQTGQTPVVIDSLEPGNNVIDLTGKVLETELAGYYHTDLVHDHMKEVTDPGFIQMDTAFRVNVELTSGSCNAFYNGVSINFFAQGGGCPATALFSDVVYHEYGHGINYEYYDFWGGFANNGALQEGYADVWAFSLSLDPIIGQGFLGGASTFVRRYDVNPKVYPQDLVGQVHADGEIIAGAFWDTYRNLGNDMDKMLELFVGAQVNTPIAPDGGEGQLYSDILLEVMLADDDDGNLVNGTPNDSAIIDGFAKHGISLLANATLAHTAPLVNPANQDVELTTRLTTALPTYLGDVMVYYRTDANAAYQSQPMTPTGAINYEVNIGPQPEGTIIDYYFVVEDVFGTEVVADPVEANLNDDPNLPYFITVGYEEQVVEDFDITFGGWAIDPFGDDDASTGQWDISVPVATFDNVNAMVQTDQDRTPNNSTNLCAFTGNASSGTMGANDVDDGKTTLQSPVFDLTTYEKPAFSYWRWFINDPAGGANPGNDPWQVFITDDGSNWVRVERTFTSDRSWRQHVIEVEDYVQKTATVSLLFVAQDSLVPGTNLDGGSIVEAAVDDLALLDISGAPTTVKSSTTAFTMQPNPAQDQVTIRYRGEVPLDRLEIIDVTGRVLQQQVWPNREIITISTTQLSAGMYWVKLYSAAGRTVQPLVIQR